MAEGFVEFDSEKLDFNPNFFSNQFDSFFKSDFNQFESQQGAYGHVNVHNMEESPETRAMDALSTDSHSSTNYSSKYSPEYMDNADNQSSIDRRYEDETLRNSKLPPIMKKGIQKLYDPIVDNNVVYKYDDDPSEYKKARKRVQNRESASRVRNKKKNYTEELESELSILKRENADLKVKNAALRAENNLLKQQTSFLEKMVMKTGHQPAMTNNPASYNEQNYEECLLPLVNKAEDKTTKNYGYFRAAPPHTFKKHAVLLGMFTIMLCTYGLMSHADDASGVPSHNWGEFKGSFGGMGLKSVDAADGKYSNGHNIDLNQSLNALLKANQEYNSIKSIAKLAITTAYIIYLVYVMLITNWRYLFRVKSNKIL